MRLTSLIKLAWLKALDFASHRSHVNDSIETVERKLLPAEQIPCPLVHHFAPGVYLREITMPAGTFVIGQEHRTKHFNVILSGRARVMIGGEVEDVSAPAVIVSEPGVRKVLHVIETMRWATIHPTNETDVPTLERLLVKPSASFIEAHELKALQGGTPCLLSQ